MSKRRPRYPVSHSRILKDKGETENPADSVIATMSVFNHWAPRIEAHTKTFDYRISEADDRGTLKERSSWAN